MGEGRVNRGSEDNHSPGVGCSVVEHGYTEVISVAIRNQEISITCHHCLQKHINIITTIKNERHFSKL